MPRRLADGETQMNFRISEEKKDAFIKKAKEEGTSASRLILDFIDGYLGISSKADEIANIKQKVAELEEFKDRAEKILGELAA
ncbi:MAG: hypothetical protein ACRDEA_00930 [Microcystaceae cyanobacterium]